MGWAKNHIEKLRAGQTVSFRPSGNSMRPLVNDGDLVTVSPDLSALKAGSVVLCRVKGREYLHLVKAVRTEGEGRLFLIGNNKGGINGWVGIDNIFGKALTVERG